MKRNIISMLTLLAFVLPFQLTHAKQTQTFSLAEKYLCDGVTFSNYKYVNELHLTKLKNTYKVFVHTPDAGDYIGSGFIVPKTNLFTLYINNTKRQQSAAMNIYKLLKNDVLFGYWIEEGYDRIGTETCRPVK